MNAALFEAEVRRGAKRIEVVIFNFFLVLKELKF